MPERRPNPEKLLRRVMDEEQKAKRGKLKIYLGAAPGVGKTYNMLNDALAKRSQGLDVVIGVVETHGRHEIEFLLDDLEMLPRQDVAYRGQTFKEFDLDAALRRNPGIILMDEMAHKNVPGLRHGRRWRDIKELLDRGIDVYTTLNVQHIESLNDVVSSIIHTKIKETVPDSMLEMADTIELVDLPPEDLIKRLQEGKVYYPFQAELAAENFFRKGNLIALRELALRVTAEHVSAEVHLYRQGEGIKHIWRTRDKILVCVGPDLESVKLIRTARRVATKYQAEWIAVYVDTVRLNANEQKRNLAIQNLRLAEQLGAETRILNGFDIVDEIISFAREQNVTQIIIAKKSRSRLADFLYRNLADELVRASGEIDVYVVSVLSEAMAQPVPVTLKREIPWKTYVVALGLTLLISGLAKLMPQLYPSTFIMLYLLSVTIVSLFGQMGPALFASVISIMAYYYLFMPPLTNLRVQSAEYVLTFIIMISVAYIISHLTVLGRQQARAARLAVKRAETMHALSRKLASTRSVDAILDVAEQFLEDVFSCQLMVFLPQDARIMLREKYKDKYQLSMKEQSIAQWVYDIGQFAGLGTDTLPFSEALYVPMLAANSTVGVLRVKPIPTDRLFSPEQMHLLEACANQIALAIEVDRIQEYAKAHELQIERDHVRNALLQSITYDLHAPLLAIIDHAAVLIETYAHLKPETINSLGYHIYAEAVQLNRIISNILQMTYLDTEAIQLQKEQKSLRDLILRVIKENKKFAAHEIKMHIPNDLPLVAYDETLMHEVIVNLLDNALKVSPKNEPVDISAQAEPGHILVGVRDCGPGVPVDELDKLFEKFYRGRTSTTASGLGLGLAICRSIISAHGGRIWVENGPEGGAVFYFTLPD